MTMFNPLASKLENVTDLDPGDRQALLDLCADTRHVAKGQDIIREGDRPHHVHLIIQGWAARYKVLPDGSRQITAFLIPGDFCDMHVTILAEMDHSILALTPVKVAHVPHLALHELRTERPNLITAFWWVTLVDEAVLRSWIVNLGRRNARTRIAHLICELHLRMTAIGLAEDGHFALPLTQEVLADALGLTSVHANRTLMVLRAQGLINWKGAGEMVIQDVAGLRRVASFDPNYLHAQPLRREGGPDRPQASPDDLRPAYPRAAS